MASLNFKLTLFPLSPVSPSSAWGCKLVETTSQKSIDLITLPMLRNSIQGGKYRLSNYAQELAWKLEQILASMSSDEQFALLTCFADARIFNDYSNAFVFNGSAKNEEDLLAAAVLFQGIYTFLISGERFILTSAWGATLFAVWQWCNALKQLCHQEGQLSESVLGDYALAYRELVTRLNDPRFIGAVRLLGANLPVPGWWSMAQLRLRLMLSLVLSPIGEEKPDSVFAKPLPAPGLDGNPELHWHEVNLHRLFREGEGRAAVRRLIRNELLPHYDFESAYWLARLLRSGKDAQRFLLPPHWWMPAAMLLFSVIAFGVSILPPISDSWLSLRPGASWLFVEWFALVIIIGGLAAFGFDIGSLPHLLLPRILGGVLIGYLIIGIQTPEFMDYLCRGNGLGILSIKWLVGLLILAVCLLSFLYLIADSYFMVETQRLEWKRAFYIWLYSVLATLVLGMMILPMAGNPCLDSGDLAQFALEAGQSACSRGYLIGPLGLVHPMTLFLFAPIALLAGLISQFIWEREPVTASIWSPGKE